MSAFVLYGRSIERPYVALLQFFECYKSSCYKGSMECNKSSCCFSLFVGTVSNRATGELSSLDFVTLILDLCFFFPFFGYEMWKCHI